MPQKRQIVLKLSVRNLRGSKLKRKLWRKKKLRESKLRKRLKKRRKLKDSLKKRKIALKRKESRLKLRFPMIRTRKLMSLLILSRNSLVT